MSDALPPVGSVGWVDLTVDDAPQLRSFYEKVVGWKSEDVSMGDYEDYVMQAPDSGEPVSGVCHRKGPNADLPGGWLVYFVVADLDESIAKVRELGGEVLGEPRQAGGRFVVVRDPSGAVCALHQPS